jgi:KaiC/GvpD/RAD55 family RecA-like ATPase
MSDYDYLVIPILKSFLRLDDSPDGDRRAQQTCFWLLFNQNRLTDLLLPVDQEILRIIHDTHWESRSAKDDWGKDKDGATLTLATLAELSGFQSTTLGMNERMNDIKEDEEDGDNITLPENGDDLDAVVLLLIRFRKSEKWLRALHVIKGAIVSSWTHPTTKKVYAGPDGATTLLYEILESGTLQIDSVRGSTARVLNEDTTSLCERYEAEEHNHSELGTGLPHLDEAFQLRRGQLLGLLGYNKHRKTTLCRSIAYNAVKEGKNVLWIALEQTYEEEQQAFQVIHCHHMFPGSKVTSQKIDRHQLDKKEKSQLKQAGLGLEQLPGKLKIIEPSSRSWNMIRSIIETDATILHYDMICIDYVTLMSSGKKDERAGMIDIIQDVKQLAKNLDALVITPIQGNRQGAERAAESGWESSGSEVTDFKGQWDKEGIDIYSEFSKSCDCIISIYYDSACQEHKQCIIGLLLCRRAGNMMPLLANVSDDAGYIYQDKGFADEVVTCLEF